MDPQLDVNALIRLVGNDALFVAFARAHQAAGLSYNRAARNEFLANGLGIQSDLEARVQAEFNKMIDAVTAVSV